MKPLRWKSNYLYDYYYYYISELKELFHLFDKDDDGVISTLEVNTILRSLGQDPSSDQILAAMRPFDVDGTLHSVQPCYLHLTYLHIFQLAAHNVTDFYGFNSHLRCPDLSVIGT